ncbi:hypothetical protein Mgra_00006222 [Meloidogyne graminicola]|uniref:Apple domain-containing protein n=1 Tax=Meloidogyne graminicola TaxID=189291 RepID=A0A8S9ZLR5_9BILA|nr:hypothetical protein Mgra_00006222 [Meloidogyne graminicola]
MLAITLPNLKLTKTTAVSSLNECAFVCYSNFCSAAIFELGQPESRCHLQIGPSETCNRRGQRHYSFRNEPRAIISCIRCSPSKPVTVSHDAELPPHITTTPLTFFNTTTTITTTNTAFSPSAKPFEILTPSPTLINKIETLAPPTLPPVAPVVPQAVPNDQHPVIQQQTQTTILPPIPPRR